MTLDHFDRIVEDAIEREVVIAVAAVAAAVLHCHIVHQLIVGQQFSVYIVDLPPRRLEGLGPENLHGMIFIIVLPIDDLKREQSDDHDGCHDKGNHHDDGNPRLQADGTDPFPAIFLFLSVLQFSPHTEK